MSRLLFASRAQSHSLMCILLFYATSEINCGSNPTPHLGSNRFTDITVWEEKL